MSNDINLGELITDGDAERDAVHVAIVPLIAGEVLHPGMKFKLKYGTKDVAVGADYNEGNEVHGVVDPFLTEWRVSKGARFYGVLMPNTVTGMRHHWEHPVFDGAARVVDSHEDWIRRFCEEWNFDYDELIEAATSTTNDWRYVVARGIDLHSRGELGEDHDLFWEHLEALNNTRYSAEHRDGMGWSCSC